MTKFAKQMMVTVSMLALSACGGAAANTETTAHHEGEEHHAAAASNAALVAPGDAHVGDRTTCPVNGEEFVVAADSPSVEYEGKTYYFCCSHCVGAFNANPAQYAHPAAATTAAQ